MSFEQEWTEAKGRANDGGSTEMRLAHALPPDSREKVDLSLSPTAMKTIAGHLQHTFQPKVAEKSRIADSATEGVSGSGGIGTAANSFTGALSDWSTGAGLRYGLRRWDQQVKTLQGRLSAARNALHGAALSFAEQDKDTKIELDDLLPDPAERKGTGGDGSAKVDISKLNDL